MKCKRNKLQKSVKSTHRLFEVIAKGIEVIKGKKDSWALADVDTKSQRPNERGGILSSLNVAVRATLAQS